MTDEHDTFCFNQGLTRTVPKLTGFGPKPFENLDTETRPEP